MSERKAGLHRLVQKIPSKARFRLRKVADRLDFRFIGAAVGLVVFVLLAMTLYR